MNHSYIFFNENLKSKESLYIEPSTYDNFYFLTFFYDFKSVIGTKKPVWYNRIILFCDYLHFRINNTIVSIHKSKRFKKNPWIHDKTPKKENNSKPDVYFIQSVVGGPIKIGVSYCPEFRLVDLQHFSPFELKIIAVISNGGYEKERGLHKRFAKNRLHGEWFKPNSEILNYIKGLRG